MRGGEKLFNRRWCAIYKDMAPILTRRYWHCNNTPGFKPQLTLTVVNFKPKQKKALLQAIGRIAANEIR